MEKRFFVLIDPMPIG